MDMFLDWNKYKGRAMTEDERVESIALDIVNARKLGCGVIRVIHDVEPAMLERLAPMAEKYEVKLALEIHAPSYYDSDLEQRLIAMFQKVQSPYLCFTLDLGVFVKRLPRVVTDRFLRDGMKKELAEYIAGAYENGSLRLSDEPGAAERMIGKIVAQGGTEQDIYLTMMGAHMICREPRTMLEYLPYTSHIHGKFYEMLPDGTEYSIPYEEIISVLVEGGYDGYINSEYEGNRWIHDAFEVDSAEQIGQHQAMLKRLLGEE
jgi:hypothetical protein